MSVLRSFRVLRLLKLAKHIRSLRVLLTTVMEVVANITYMSLTVFLFIFMFAILGMQGASLVWSLPVARGLTWGNPFPVRVGVWTCDVAVWIV